MSEQQPIDEYITASVLRFATQPLGTRQDIEAWYARVNAAYRNLCLNYDFRLVLEHWVKMVVLDNASDAGERRFIVRLIQLLHAVQEGELQRQGG